MKKLILFISLLALSFTTEKEYKYNYVLHNNVLHNMKGSIFFRDSVVYSNYTGVANIDTIIKHPLGRKYLLRGSSVILLEDTVKKCVRLYDNSERLIFLTNLPQ